MVGQQLVSESPDFVIGGRMKAARIVVDVDERDLGAQAGQQLNQLACIFASHVHAGDSDVGEAHSAATSSGVFAHGCHDLGKRPAFLRRHERQARLAGRRGQGNDQPKTMSLGREAPNGRGHAHGRNRNGFARDGWARRVRQDLRRADHVVVVEQGLAHTEKEHAANRVISLGAHGPHLRQHLPHRQAAHATAWPQPARGAEVTRQGATQLRADTQGVLRRGQRHQPGCLAALAA